MTLTKRISEIHRRTVMRARSTVPAAMRRISAAGLSSHPLADGIELVADRFQFCPALGFWKSVDGKKRGYTVTSLIAAARA